ncbi:MAG: site-specific DNA-methyltransferase [Bacteroidota bacterium]|nr:site-specific DNA-methyltransferase [Bacteroidota bacterium]
MAKQQKKKNKSSDKSAAVYKKVRKTKKQTAVKSSVQQPQKQTTIELSKAKGRPMLVWVGKKPLERLTAFPAQKIEEFTPPDTRHPELVSGSKMLKQVQHDEVWNDWSPHYPKTGLLFHGDNKEVLAHLLANGFRGKVKLIYIDPPFDSGADYVRKVNLRGMKASSKIDAANYTLGEQTQYTDIWTNDYYLQFMYDRLLLLKELLCEDGSIYLHCDWHMSHFLRNLMDEVFGSNNIQNEIVWKRTSARSDSKTFNHIHDSILFYSKGDGLVFNQLLVSHDEDYLERYYIYKEPDGRRFATIDATQSGITKSGESGKPWRGFDPSSKGNHWKFGISELQKLEKVGRIYWPEKEGGWPRLKSYLDEVKGMYIQSIWTDIKTVNSQAAERGDYPTQKPEALLERIVNSSSNPGDIVLDCFIGSGTTAAVAQKLGRRWIGCDINKGAIQTTSKRLQTIITEQIEEEKKKSHQGKLELGEDSKTQPILPAQYSFSVYRVNDYDLQIQHNEAVNLACEHIGITRTKTDSFFEGTLGKKLVKIVPFNHPVTQLDLEQIKNELKVRPNETRDITVVALGKELATDAWLAEWNKMRKAKEFPNKMELIELRTDKKYGKFIEHKPASAKVSIKREKEKAKIVIENFISPAIIERLGQQEGPLRPQITDWHSMVDCVMIDPNYDGKVFTIALSDVPEKKNDFVIGEYEIPIAKNKTTVAVKIIDMLGEEVIVAEEV